MEESSANKDYQLLETILKRVNEVSGREEQGMTEVTANDEEKLLGGNVRSRPGEGSELLTLPAE
jgi:hypothetical protein